MAPGNTGRCWACAAQEQPTSQQTPSPSHTLAPFERNDWLRQNLSMKPQVSQETCVSFESVQALPNFKTVQRSEESIGMGCMHAPLCQILHGREGTGRKQRWHAVCIQGLWDSERLVCPWECFRVCCFSGSRDQGTAVLPNVPLLMAKLLPKIPPILCSQAWLWRAEQQNCGSAHYRVI